jgi:hypothetical protein
LPSSRSRNLAGPRPARRHSLDDADTRPFSICVTHRLMTDGKLDADLIEFVCQENNKAPQLMVGK